MSEPSLPSRNQPGPDAWQYAFHALIGHLLDAASMASIDVSGAPLLGATWTLHDEPTVAAQPIGVCIASYMCADDSGAFAPTIGTPESTPTVVSLEASSRSRK
jgi:hypothetical protein